MDEGDVDCRTVMNWGAISVVMPSFIKAIIMLLAKNIGKMLRLKSHVIDLRRRKTQRKSNMTLMYC